MTLKQFLEVAGGVLAGWLVWSLNLPGFLRWPTTIMVGLSGIALAFLPLEDRPLDKWVISFFKGVYRPTIFTWKKPARTDLLQFTPRANEDQKILASAAKAPSAGLKTLLQLYQTQTAELETADPLEEAWVKRGQSLPDLFQTVQVSKKLAQEISFPQKMAVGPTHPDTRVYLRPMSEPTDPLAILRGEITLSPRQPRIPESSQLSTLIDNAGTTEKTVPGQRQVQQEQSMATGVATAQTQTLRGGTFATALGMTLPAAPTFPNILSGMVFTSSGQIIDSAIIEIRDQQGMPVRALKTNKLGQFSIATPLSNGTYELEIEKPGLHFDILKIDAKGSVIPPIEIRAKDSVS